MGAVSLDADEQAGKSTAEKQTFWQRLARALDRLVVQRSRHAVPANMFRRSKNEHDRCRRMIHATIPATRPCYRMSSKGAVRATGTPT